MPNSRLSDKHEALRNHFFYAGTNDVDVPMNQYSQFLEDGDFEKWHPCCYGEFEDGAKWIELRDEASLLRADDLLDPQSFEYRRQLMRVLWIQSRFLLYGTDEFHQQRVKRDLLYKTFTMNEKLSDWWAKNY